MTGFKIIWYLGTTKTKKMKCNEWKCKVLNLLIHKQIQEGAANSWLTKDPESWRPAEYEWGTLKAVAEGVLWSRAPMAEDRLLKNLLVHKSSENTDKSDQNQHFQNSGNYPKSHSNPRSICSRKNGWISSKTECFMAFQFILFPSAFQIFIQI